MHNAAGEQRPKLLAILHGLYDKPLSTRRLLHWFVGLLFRVSWPKSFQHGVVLSVEGF